MVPRAVSDRRDNSDVYTCVSIVTCETAFLLLWGGLIRVTEVSCEGTTKYEPTEFGEDYIEGEGVSGGRNVCTVHDCRIRCWTSFCLTEGLRQFLEQ